MQEYLSIAPVIAICVSLVAAILIVISRRYQKLCLGWTIGSAVIKFAVVASMLPPVLSGVYPAITLFELSPGISLAFEVDPVAMIFGLSASLLWVITSVFNIEYTRIFSWLRDIRYFASFAVCLAATIGIAFAANLFTLLIFYELLTIATYPLVVIRGHQESIFAGKKYLAYLLTAGAILIVATALTYRYAGTLDFMPGGFLNAGVGADKLLVLAVLFIIGFGVKAALMPFHSWLPTAMVAPVPVSALLHAVAVVKAGAFGFVRVIGFVFGPALFHDIGAGTILSIMAGITILISSLLAIGEDHLKRRLAYSTVGHLSYILLGLSLFSPIGWIGALLHIVNHAMMKITLFFCAGAIAAKTGLDRVSQLGGIGKQMPYTMAAFTLASLGLIGVPPISGFISKLFLGQGALGADLWIFLALLLVSGLLNAGYFLPIIRRAFFVPSDMFVKYDEAPLLFVIPLSLTALLALYFGLQPNGLFDFFKLATDAATSVFAGGIR